MNINKIIIILSIIVFLSIMIWLIVWSCNKSNHSNDKYQRPKFFTEKKGHPHLDAQYGKIGMSHKEVQSSLVSILKEFMEFCKQNNVKPILMYGGLIGHYFNKKMLPWDDDLDMIILDDVDNLKNIETETMIVKVNPNIKSRKKDPNNIIGARVINKNTGVFIDIVYHRNENDILKCTDGNDYKYEDIISPNGYVLDKFENIDVYIPYNVKNVLRKRYGKKVFNTSFNNHTFNTILKEWVKD